MTVQRPDLLPADRAKQAAVDRCSCSCSPRCSCVLGLRRRLRPHRRRGRAPLAVVIAWRSSCRSSSARVAYYGGDSLVLAASQAPRGQRAGRAAAHERRPRAGHRGQHPDARVYLIDDTAPNAFATGRDPQHASVAVTTGPAREARPRGAPGRHRPRAVARPQPRHPLRAAGRRAGRVSIALLADFFLRFTFWSGVSAATVAAATVAAAAAGRSSWSSASSLAILAPIFARLVQLAVSRQREYLADASSVELTRNPYGLERALAKIASDQEVAGGRQPGDPAPVHRQPHQEARGARASGLFVDPSADRRPHQPAPRADRRGAGRPSAWPLPARLSGASSGPRLDRSKIVVE